MAVGGDALPVIFAGENRELLCGLVERSDEAKIGFERCGILREESDLVVEGRPDEREPLAESVRRGRTIRIRLMSHVVIDVAIMTLRGGLT
jgi:hypothetical protein